MPNPEVGGEGRGEGAVYVVVPGDVQGLMEHVARCAALIHKNADLEKAKRIVERFQRVMGEEDADNPTAIFASALWAATVVASMREVLGVEGPPPESVEEVKTLFSSAVFHTLVRGIVNRLLEEEKDEGGAEVV